MSDADEKSPEKNSCQTDPGQDKRTLTKLSVNFYGQGAFEGMTLEEVLRKYPKGSKVIINGVEATVKGR